MIFYHLSGMADPIRGGSHFSTNELLRVSSNSACESDVGDRTKNHPKVLGSSHTNITIVVYFQPALVKVEHSSRVQVLTRVLHFFLFILRWIVYMFHLRSVLSEIFSKVIS